MIIFLAVYLLFAVCAGLDLGKRFENIVLDVFYRLEPASAQPKDILIVGIDELSFKEFKLPWPWPRRMHAELIDRLHLMGARLIAFDMLFSEATQDDGILTEAIKRAGNVILGKTIEIVNEPRFSRQMLIEPVQPFRSAARALGSMMISPDPDGVVRYFRMRIGGHETLSAVMVECLSPFLEVPSDLSGLIDYAGPPRTLDMVSYFEVLDKANPLPEERVRGKIILVGRMLEASPTPQGQADSFYTPFTAASGQLMSGVELHGNILRTLMNENWGNEPTVGWKLLFGLLLILSAAMATSRTRIFAALGITALLVLLAFAASLVLFNHWRLWMPPAALGISLFITYVASVSWKYLLEFGERRWLRAAFGRYVSHSLVETIIAHPERLELGGEETEVTVLFADLAGFTSLAEGMSPKDLISILNEYFAAMTGIILNHLGTLDKFIGDAIMGVWGAPLAMSDHAFRACKGALEMQAFMPRLQSSWQERGLPTLSARVGLHSGRVLAGNVGSSERFSYTVMGDTVNLASRLEGLNKLYGTKILLSDSTYNLVSRRFSVREIDQVRVKGRLEPVTIYELLGPILLESSLPWLTAFKAGRNAYKALRWSEAEGYFRDVLQLKPDDGPSRTLLNRCRQYREQPPPPEWQGVFVLTEK